MSKKRLIICCDGTWNTPDEANEGQSAPTNVTKVALCVAPQDGSGMRATSAGSAHVRSPRVLGVTRRDRPHGLAIKASPAAQRERK